MKKYLQILTLVTGVACLAVDNPVRLDVTARPEGAHVLVDGVSKGTVPLSVFDIKPGNLLVRVEAPGYRPAEEYVRVNAGQFVRRDYELEPQSGLLLVLTEPAGADVRKDGVSLGTTPLFLHTLRTDTTHTLELVLTGYRTKKIDAVLEGRTPVVRTEELQLDSGIVECTSEPSGAEVLVNGVSRGTTPVQVAQVPKGVATVMLKLAGYEDATRELRIAPGDRQTLSLKLVPKPALVKVVSAPEGARVMLDNDYRGKTPLEIANLTPGVHMLRVELAGYSTEARTLTVKNGDEKTEEFTFKSILGRLEITTVPPGVTITVDGKKAGVTKSFTRGAEKSDILAVEGLSAGEHQVVAHMRGYADKTLKTQIEAQKTVSRSFRMVRVFSPDTEIETVNGTYRGVLVPDQSTDSYLRLEVKQGITQDFRRDQIRRVKTLD